MTNRFMYSLTYIISFNFHFYILTFSLTLSLTHSVASQLYVELITYFEFSFLSLTLPLSLSLSLFVNSLYVLYYYRILTDITKIAIIDDSQWLWPWFKVQSYFHILCSTESRVNLSIPDFFFNLLEYK